MKIHELITFVENHTKLNRLIIEPYGEVATSFEGSVIELLKTHYLFLDIPVENATYNIVSATLQIFYDPADL